MAHEPAEHDKRVADFWDEHTDDTFTGETYWLANPMVARRYNAKSVGGRQYESWVNFFVEHFLGEKCPVNRVLNIGAGDGALDRHLVSLNTATMIDAIDLAPNRIEIARTLAEKEGMSDKINYFVGNAVTSPYPHNRYDAIFFNSSLHHIDELDAILARCAESLEPDGYLFINEYIGPSRYAFSEREKQAMQALFQLIPEKYRLSRHAHDWGELKHRMEFPTPEQVEQDDPSEAINSAEIPDALRRHFHIEEFNDQGGSLLQFVLHGIIGNFTVGDPKAKAILDMLFQIEDQLVQLGDIPVHFALIVCRPLQTT